MGPNNALRPTAQQLRCWVPSRFARRRRVKASVRRICVTDDAECINYLLSQCPAFLRHWKEHRAPYGDEPTPGGLMFDLAAFGTYAADAIERNEAAELAAIAEAAE